MERVQDKGWVTFLRLCCCSAAKSCPTLCNPMNCSTPGSSVLHCLLEFAQIHVHWVGDAIQPSHPLPHPFALNLSQHQGLFQWVGSLHQVAKVLELQLQHQTLQWIFRVDFLAVQRILKSLLSLLQHNSKTSIFRCSAFFEVQLYICTWLLKKPVLTTWTFVDKVISAL